MPIMEFDLCGICGSRRHTTKDCLSQARPLERPKCGECGCLLPAHYGSCSQAGGPLPMRQGNSLEQVAKVMRQGQTNSAKLVRDAINAIATDSQFVGWWGALAERETDEVLDRLRRLLK